MPDFGVAEPWSSAGKALRGAVCLALAVGGSHAAERHTILMHDLATLPGAISDVAQDGEGFLWVSSAEGLFRFDGSEFVRRGARIRFDSVAAGPVGSVVAGEQDEPWYEWTGGTLSPIAGADGEPLAEVQAAAFDREGTLWLVARKRALRRATSGGWDESPLPAGLTGLSVVADPEGGVIVGTREGAILRLVRGAAPERIFDGLRGLVAQVAVAADGALIANVRWGPNRGVVRLRSGRLEHLAASDGRATGLALRGSTIWSSWDNGVLALRDGDAGEWLRPREGFSGGGHVRVDRDGALWVTGFAGDLALFPEPDTRVYSERSGVAHASLRNLVTAGGERWVGTWEGALRYAPSTDRFEPFDALPYAVRDLVYATRRGDVFTVGLKPAASGAGERATLLRIRGGRVEPVAEVSSEPRAVATPGGGLFLVFSEKLHEISPDGELSEPRPLPDAALPVEAITVAPDGAVWVAGSSGPFCRSRDERAGWDCVTPSGLGRVLRMAVVENGRVWVATAGQGLLECDRSSCRPLLDADVLGTQEVVGLTPSPRGGLWVVGRTAALRVRSESGAPKVVERLSRWQGLPPWWLSSLHEDSDGTVWVVGLAGIARVPSSAREEAVAPPVVRAIRLTVSGRELPLDRAATAISGSDTIELRWAALTFRDPSRLRYRFRLDPSLPWVATEAPRLILAAPQAGRYRVEMAATLEPAPASVATAAVDLHVVPPWYRRAPFLVAAALVVVGCAIAVYRVRVAHVLRLERQRTQIAMDLHDDLGATLGGVGLLASLAEDEALPPIELRSILRRIARQTGSAADSLSDIVWSLRPGAETLDQLVLSLRDRAGALCPDGRVELSLAIPDPCPRVRLTLPVRRNVQWIAVEALRNAVRHADPRRVEIRLDPVGPAWRLTIEDDGRGLTAAAPGGRGGFGMENMRRRAGWVGARLEVEPGARGGTRISLVFRPDGRRRRTIV